VLQGNGVIGVAVDRPVGADEGVPITFFGRQCYVPGGIAQLALKSGAALLPGFCWYDDEYSSAYYVSAGPLIIPESTGDKHADTIALTQRMFDALESEIHQRPEQWAMFRRFWPEREEGKEQEMAPAPAERVTAGEIGGSE
jgi:lauroyl/myristoyl acyltransferase